MAVGCTNFHAMTFLLTALLTQTSNSVDPEIRGDASSDENAFLPGSHNRGVTTKRNQHVQLCTPWSSGERRVED